MAEDNGNQGTEKITLLGTASEVGIQQLFRNTSPQSRKGMGAKKG